MPEQADSDNQTEVQVHKHLLDMEIIRKKKPENAEKWLFDFGVMVSKDGFKIYFKGPKIVSIIKTFANLERGKIDCARWYAAVPDSEGSRTPHKVYRIERAVENFYGFGNGEVKRLMYNDWPDLSWLLACDDEIIAYSQTIAPHKDAKQYREAVTKTLVNLWREYGRKIEDSVRVVL